jgi:hypothetical protein
MLCVIDEVTREALAILVKRRLNAMEVLEVLADLIIVRGAPGFIRSDNRCARETTRNRAARSAPPARPPACQGPIAKI